MTMAYAAPEFFQGQTSNHSDQYSLAVTYCQLRGGRLPFAGTPAQIVAGHLQQPPDLSMLPEAEQPAVARALAKNPAERWPNCRAFVQALLPVAAAPLDETALYPGAAVGNNSGTPARRRGCLPWVCCAALLLALLVVWFAPRPAENPEPDLAANQPAPTQVQKTDPDATPPPNNPNDTGVAQGNAEDVDPPKENPKSDPKVIPPKDNPMEIANPQEHPKSDPKVIAPKDNPMEIANPQEHPKNDPKVIGHKEQPKLKKDQHGLRKFTVTIVNASEIKHYHYWLDANNNIVPNPPQEVLDEDAALAQMPPAGKGK
jgi:hypothetical protein